MQEGFLDPKWGPTSNYPGCETNVQQLMRVWA